MGAAWLLGYCALIHAQQSGTYPIQLHRKVKQGDRVILEIVAGSNVQMKTTWHGLAQPSLTESTSVIRFLAEVTFLEVNEAGDTVKEEYKVRALTQLRDKDKTETTLIPPGTVMLVEGTETDTSFTVNGAPVSPEVKEELSQFITAAKNQRKYNQDHVWGTSQPKRIGDKWPADAKAMVERMAIGGTITTADKVSGEAELLAVESYDGEPCLKVQLRSELKDFNVSWPTGSMKLKQASGTMQTDTWVPLSTEKISPRHISTAKYRYLLEGESEGRRFSTEHITLRETQLRLLRE